MTFFLTLILMVAAIYSSGMYLYLAYRTYAKGENWEQMSFHLGLCAILAAGFLLVADAQYGAVKVFMEDLRSIHSPVS